MASTFTNNNGIEKPGTGEQSGTWGNTVNTNMDLWDEALEGQTTVTLPGAGSDITPNAFPIAEGATSDARHRYVDFIDGGDLGTTAYVQLTPNNAQKIYFVRNNLSGGRSIIFFQGTYDAGRDIELTNGARAILFFDGGGGTATVSAFYRSDFISITGGNINGTAVGGVTPSSGTFTGLNATTAVTLDRTGSGAGAYLQARADDGFASGVRIYSNDDSAYRPALVNSGDDTLRVGNATWTAQEMRGNWTCEGDWVWANTISVDRTGISAPAYVSIKADDGQISGIRLYNNDQLSFENALTNDGADTLRLGANDWTSQAAIGDWTAIGAWTHNANLTIDRVGQASGAFVVVTNDAGFTSGYRIAHSVSGNSNALIANGSDELQLGSASWDAQTTVGAWTHNGLHTFTSSTTFSSEVDLDRTGDGVAAYLNITADDGQAAALRMYNHDNMSLAPVIRNSGTDTVIVGNATWTGQQMAGDWDFLNAFTGVGATFTGDLSAGTISGDMRASNAEAIAGTATNKVMTPQRVREAIDDRALVAAEGARQVTTGSGPFEFTNIPSTATYIVVMLEGVSLSGTDGLLVQLGTSGSYATAGYNSRSTRLGVSVNTSSTGFLIQSGDATAEHIGQMTLTKVAGTDTWLSTHTTNIGIGGGSLNLGATLTRLRLNRTLTNSFDAGAVSIRYW